MSQDEIEALDSSDSAALDEAKTAKAVDGVATDSSAVTNDVKDTLSIVRDVVAEKDAESSASSAEGDAKEGQAEASQVIREPDNENYSDVPFHKHKRFQDLVSERNELREQVQSIEADAKRARNIQTFLADNGISDAEAADALMVAALRRSDPVQAWTMLRPLVEELLHAAGEILPPDLEQRVQAGELARDIAVQINRQNAQLRSMTTRQQFDQKRMQTQAERDAGSARMNAATAWEQERRLKDPNFAAKQEAIAKEIKWLQHKEGMPTTPEGVKELCEKAYKAVNASFRPATPSPRRQQSGRPSAMSQGADAQPKPESTLDIIRAHTRRA